MRKTLLGVVATGVIVTGCADGGFGGKSAKAKEDEKEKDMVARVEDGTPALEVESEGVVVQGAIETPMTCAAYKSEVEELWLTRSLYQSLAGGLDVKAAAALLGEQIAVMEGKGFGKAHVELMEKTHAFLVAGENVPSATAAQTELGMIEGLLAETVLVDGGCDGMALAASKTTRAKGTSLLDAAFEDAKSKNEKLKALEKEKTAIAEYNVLPIPRATIVHHGDHIMADYGGNKLVEKTGTGPGYKVGITVSLGCEDWKPLKIYDKWDCRLTLNGNFMQTWDKVGCVFKDYDSQPGQYCAVCEAIPAAWPAGVDLASKRTQVCVNVK